MAENKNETSILLNHTGNDPTWQRALAIVRDQLQVPYALAQLFQSGWNERLTLDEYARRVSFSGIRAQVLADAVNAGVLPEVGRVSSAQEAMRLLGPNLSAVLLAIRYTTDTVLRRRPPPTWIPIFKQMIAGIEIGARFGSRVQEISTGGGMLIAFARHAGLALLLTSDPKAFKRWQSLSGGVENQKIQLDVFGCEAYQLSAFVLQQLGFGVELALGAALATGNLDPRLLNLERRELRWKAAYLWIEALREGRGYPAEIAIRDFFEPIKPGRDGKNVNLSILYTEVAKVKSNGSLWAWHLPASSYEDTQRLIGE